MKVVVSYINSIYDEAKTIELIDKCVGADGIHCDLMDGKYVTNNNFCLADFEKMVSGCQKKLDIHLMVENPSQYFEVLEKLNPECIYIHPDSEANYMEALEKLNDKAGIAINPDEEINKWENTFGSVKRVLLMSVVPGKGGQKFLENTKERLTNLLEYKKKYGFSIYVDGGINDITIEEVNKADGVVVGSFICRSEDFQKQIELLKSKEN